MRRTRQGKVESYKTRQDKTRQDKTRQDKTRQDKTRQEMTNKAMHILTCLSSLVLINRPLVKTRHDRQDSIDKSRHENTRQDKTWQTRHDKTKNDVADAKQNSSQRASSQT